MDPLIMAAIAGAQAIEQAQQAKKLQEAEAAKTAYSPWTNMQAAMVKTPNNPFIEAAGGYVKGMEYDDAKKEKQMQQDYLGKRMAYMDRQEAGQQLTDYNKANPNAWMEMDKVMGVKTIGGK